MVDGTLDAGIWSDRPSRPCISVYRSRYCWEDDTRQEKGKGQLWLRLQWLCSERCVSQGG